MWDHDKIGSPDYMYLSLSPSLICFNIYLFNYLIIIIIRFLIDIYLCIFFSIKRGHVTFDLNVIPQDRIVDIHPPLQPRKGKKETISGTIHLRIYHSTARETRPPAQHGTPQHPDPANPQFLYRPYKSAFKPGDLIGYGGYGIISGLQKIITASPITRYTLSLSLPLSLPLSLLVSNLYLFSVGMVVYLPNKWTGDTEPYVVEMTRYILLSFFLFFLSFLSFLFFSWFLFLIIIFFRNVNRNIDEFTETNNRTGIYIFHLFERFHQFHGSDLVHFPLVHPLPADMYKKVVERVLNREKERRGERKGGGKRESRKIEREIVPWLGLGSFPFGPPFTR
jgi:hypothetical protein